MGIKEKNFRRRLLKSSSCNVLNWTAVFMSVFRGCHVYESAFTLVHRETSLLRLRPRGLKSGNERRLLSRPYHCCYRRSLSLNSFAMNQTRTNDSLPPDMIFGEAQIISISAYTPLFIISAVLNLRVLRKLWQTKQRNGLSRLNQLLMHLVLADLSVSYFTYITASKFPKYGNPN